MPQLGFEQANYDPAPAFDIPRASENFDKTSDH